MRRTNIYLTEGQLATLAKLSERTGLSMAELVRRAVDAMLSAEERKEAKKGGNR